MKSSVPTAMPAAETVFTGPDLCRLTARAAVAALRAGEVSPAELIDAAMARIGQTAGDVNATVTPCPDRARGKAASVAPDSLLAGLPLGIKDLTPVAGVRTTWGNAALADFVPEASDPLVTRIEARGGVVIGKTNTPEMGAGANTFNAVFGMTRNPWDTRMNAGGSSGGAAASLAVGEAWLSHGSDLGGSLRTPASFCGIVGLRPSPGVAGGGPALQSFDGMPVQGPMARNVADCALFLDAMAGFDPVWPLSWPAPGTSYLAQCLQEAGPVRIGFAPDFGGVGPVEPAMVAALRAGLAKLSGTPFDVIEDSPDTTGAVACFRALRALGFLASARTTPEAVKAAYKPALKQNIADGAALQVNDVADALVTRSQLYDRMLAFLGPFDVIAAPVSGIAPLPVEIEYPPLINGVESSDYLDWLCFAMPASLCGLPALSLPLGFTGDGLPVGVQLIGRPRGEGRLLQIARGIEELVGFPRTPIDPVRRH